MFCSNCGSELQIDEVFCGKCGTKNDVKPAKNSDPASYSISPPESSRPQPPQYSGSQMPMTQTPARAGMGYPGQNLYLMPQTRDFWMWFILGFCTCGIASIIYVYHNFNDVRKLEVALNMRQTQPTYMNQTSDPWVGLIAYFICSPIAYIMKYSNLNTFIDYRGEGFRDPKPATAGKLVGVWVGAFFSFIFGLLFLPLLLVAVALVVYVIYLEKEWQDALNFQIARARQTQ